MTTDHPTKDPAVSPAAPPTLEHVARLAGVSAMTVSRVMNNAAGVRQATREKVLAAAAALHYAPNQAARSLSGARPLRIGLLYNNPNAGYLSELLVGLLAQASTSNVHLVIEKCGLSVVEHARQLVAHGIDGIVLAPPLGDLADVVDLLARADVPVLAVACAQPDPRISAISVDDYRAAWDMTCHLIGLGHHRIGFIVGNDKQSSSQRRLAAFKDAVAAHGADADTDLIVQGTFSYRSGLDAAETLLRLQHRPSAIFASNDDMAAATVAVAHRLGLSVPGDLTVAGFDDSTLATMIWPALSTIRQPIGEMAVCAVRTLELEIRARAHGKRVKPALQIVEFELIRRQSDAAPRARPPSVLSERR